MFGIKKCDEILGELRRLCTLGEFEAAASVIAELSSDMRNSASVLNIEGVIKLKLGFTEAAIRVLDQAISLDPTYVLGFINLANAHLKARENEKALKACNQGLDLEPANCSLLNVQGAIYLAQNQYDYAIDSLSRALTIKPDFELAHLNIGLCYHETGKFHKAEEHYLNALNAGRSSVEAGSNLALLYKDWGDLDRAIDICLNLLSKHPSPKLKHTLGLLKLLEGDFISGFELFEYRSTNTVSEGDNIPRMNQLVNDCDLKGSTVVVFAEQGLGDTIQFSRYLLKLLALGARVRFHCDSRMHHLFSTLSEQLILLDVDEPPVGDCLVNIMSLPYLLQPLLHNTITYSEAVPYLRASSTISNNLRHFLAEKKIKIAVCWQGNPGKIDIGRSFQLKWLEKISRLPDVQLISVQTGYAASQIEQFNGQITEFGGDFDGAGSAFLDTTAVIENCDLVITSDTSVAHLAGALGCTVWLALKFVPDWRWGLHSCSTEWYPSMRLFRQSSAGDWEPVFEAMYERIKVL